MYAGCLEVSYDLTEKFDTMLVIVSMLEDQMVQQSLIDGRACCVISITSNSYKPAIDALKGLHPEGRMVIMGVSTEPLNISALPLFLYRQHILGSQQNGMEYLYEALDLVARGKVKL
jgi:D-arabinose 1-dehydrogenase-like Zn-dependent alcohol dehydrogenase